MSELTTGGINFGYQSPIYQIVEDISTQIIQDGENQIFQAIQKSGVVVDKPELIKALQYDRNQYDKGYSDGRASMVEELEDIKEEIYRHHNITCNLKCATCFLEYNCELRRKIDLLEDLKIIDNHISELKGEDKEKPFDRTDDCLSYEESFCEARDCGECCFRE